MSAIDTFTDRVLRIAVTRWPSDTRDDLAREWFAEIHAIRSTDETPGLKRCWTQLRFAFSLAASPPVEDPSATPMGWRERMSQTGHLTRRVLMLLAVGVLCALGNGLAGSLARVPHIPVVSIFGMLAAAAALCLLGRRLGSAVPLSLGNSSRSTFAAGALTLTCLGAVAFAIVGQAEFKTGIELLAYLIWVLPFAGLFTVVSRLVREGKTRKAWFMGAGGGLLLLALVTIPMGLVYAYIGPFTASLATNPSVANLGQVDYLSSPLWLVQSLTSNIGASLWQGGIIEGNVYYSVTSGLATNMPALLLAAAFAVGYLHSSARAEAVTAETPDPTRTKAPVAA